MKEIEELIRYHFRRTPKDERFDFLVLLKTPEGRLIKYGTQAEEGNLRGYKKIFELMKKGYEFVAVQSTFKWEWEARRYISEIDEEAEDFDVYGRPFVADLWLGYYTRIDVLENGVIRRYSSKYAFNNRTSRQKIYFYPSKVEDMEKMFDGSGWGVVSEEVAV